MKIFGLIEKLITRFSSVGNRAFFDLEIFPWVEEVELYFPSIKIELDRVLSSRRIPRFQDISPDQSDLTDDDGWKTFFFYAFGEVNTDNCDFCPATALALSKIPGMVTAFYSILEPGKAIPPHRGPYKGVLRYHLALQATPQMSWIHVGKSTRYWEEGKSLIFDDTFVHSAMNADSRARRVVLFVDFLRPLPFPLNLLNRAIVRYIRSTDFVQAGVRRLKELNK